MRYVQAFANPLESYTPETRLAVARGNYLLKLPTTALPR